MPKSVEVKMVGVVGPFASTGSCAVVLGCKGKMVALPCETQLVQPLIVSQGVRTPYADMVDIVGACGLSVLSCSIMEEGGMTYSLVLMGAANKKPLKMSVEGPSMAIGLSKASGSFLSMPEQTLDSLPDCGNEYGTLRERVPDLYPLPDLTVTEDLRATCDFMDRVRWQ